MRLVDQERRVLFAGDRGDGGELQEDVGVVVRMRWLGQGAAQIGGCRVRGAAGPRGATGPPQKVHDRRVAVGVGEQRVGGGGVEVRRAVQPACGRTVHGTAARARHELPRGALDDRVDEPQRAAGEEDRLVGQKVGGLGGSVGLEPGDPCGDRQVGGVAEHRGRTDEGSGVTVEPSEARSDAADDRRGSEFGDRLRVGEHPAGCGVDLGQEFPQKEGVAAGRPVAGVAEVVRSRLSERASHDGGHRVAVERADGDGSRGRLVGQARDGTERERALTGARGRDDQHP